MSSPSSIARPSLGERLQEVTETLAAARTPEDVFGVVLSPALQALDAVAGAVLLVDETGERLDLAATQGHEENAQTLWQDGPLDGNVPAGDALERREALFFEQEGDLVQAYPELEARTGGVAAVATAVLPMFLDDRPLGTIILDFEEPHHFTPEEQRFLRTLAAQCAVALGRTRLLTDLQRQVDERTQQLQEGARAQEVFVAFTEAVGTETDVLALARQAVRVLRTNLEHVSVAYYELGGRRWKAQAWSEDVAPEVAAQMQAGVPEDAPDFIRAVQSGTGVFVEGWDAPANALSSATMYGAAAFLPIFIGGTVHSLLAVGRRQAQVWTERERAIVRALARGLSLALQRAEQAQHLQARTDEEVRRNQALSAFAELSRDLVLETDPLVLIRRTQEIVLVLLPAGFSGYFEPRGGLWRIGSQVGHANTPELQAALDAGLPFEAASNLLTPWRSGQPYYQDEYDPDLDHLTGSDEYPGASVTLPIVVGGQTRGILGFALYTVRRWSGEDRAVLETVGRQLTLALERAEGTADLAWRTEELARSNAELEQFAYIASHDLQAPIRAVTSFAGIIARKYDAQLDDRGRLYLRQIMDSGEHMKRLVDDLLAFSRVHTQRGDLWPVDAAAVFDTVQRRLSSETEAKGSRVMRGELPEVCADAQQLDQLFQNLISNGLKYHREGVPPQVHVRAERDGAMWRFAVQDNGIGIEPQYFDRIFVIFQRLHGRDTYEGTGIGLAVCKKIVERHGGRLWLESTPGQGSTFFFTLPAG